MEGGGKGGVWVQVLGREKMLFMNGIRTVLSSSLLQDHLRPSENTRALRGSGQEPFEISQVGSGGLQTPTNRVGPPLLDLTRLHPRGLP